MERVRWWPWLVGLVSCWAKVQRPGQVWLKVECELSLLYGKGCSYGLIFFECMQAAGRWVYEVSNPRVEDNPVKRGVSAIIECRKGIALLL